MFIVLLAGCTTPFSSQDKAQKDRFFLETSRKIAHSPQTVVVYLVGFAGTGKYTIAKKMSKAGYKVVDNHLINNPIFSLVTEDMALNSNIQTKINHIRNVVFAFMQEDNRSNYVLTNELLDTTYHRGIYEKVQQTAAKRGSIFIPVRLIISHKERANRIVQLEREQAFKTTDVNVIYNHRNMLSFSHENLLELNVTRLSAEEAAKAIILHVERAKKVLDKG